MSRPPVEEPVRTETDRFSKDDTISTHPAYGQITLHKINGSSVLYGSDFVHHQCVRITIHRSELNRSLSQDWHHQRDTLIEVDLSEAQWANYVSSFNLGSGVPCTLRYVANDEVPIKPYLPDPDLRREYSVEVAKRLDDAALSLYKLKEKIKAETIKLPKKVQAELLEPIERAITQIKSNVPFVKESFDKHVEDSIEKAKVEVNAYATNIIMRAGLEAIEQRKQLLEISDGTKGQVPETE